MEERKDESGVGERRKGRKREAGFPLESKKKTYVRPDVKFWTYRPTIFLSTITPGLGLCLLSFSRIHNHDSRTVLSIINTRILQFQCRGPGVADPFALLRGGILVVPFARTAAMQDRAFSVAGPRVWNDLPQKRHLFHRL